MGLSALAASLVSFDAAAAAGTWNFNPEPGVATDLSVIKITFPEFGSDAIMSDTHSKVNARLVNNTSGTTYVAYKCEYDWSTYNAMTMYFSVEGTSDQASITADGEYTLSIAPESFKNGNYYNQESGQWGWSSPAITAEYTIGGGVKNEMSNYTLSPKAGSVTSIPHVKITFPDTGWDGIDILSTDGISLTSADGDVFKVVGVTGNYTQTATLTFNHEFAMGDEPLTILNPGAYTLSVPAGAFKFDDWFATEDIVNGPISAIFVIEADEHNSVAQASVTPRQGEVKTLSAIQFSYGGGGVPQFADSDRWHEITISYHGNGDATYECVGIEQSDIHSGDYKLTFAAEGETEPVILDTPGDYVLNIPAGFFSDLSGVNYNERMYNAAQNVCYVIAVPTGDTDLEAYELSHADGSVLTEINSIGVTFPDAVNGVRVVDSSNVVLIYTPAKVSEDEPETVAGTDASETINSCGYSIKNRTVYFDFDRNGETIAADGTYKLVIPAGTLQEYGNPNSQNSLIEATYTIGDLESSVVLIGSENDGWKIYSLDGILVCRDAMTPGIYVMRRGAETRTILVK